MEDTLISLLESLEYPVYRQGSIAEDEPYPATFFTFWNRSEDGISFYDNSDYLVSHSFDVNVYSSNVSLAYSLQRAARDLLKSNGWTITERGYDVSSDEVTHIGRGFSCLYLEQIQ